MINQKEIISERASERSIHICDALISGSATEDQARHMALDLVSILLDSVSSCIDCIGSIDRSKQVEQLDEASETRSRILMTISLFDDRYPWCAKIIRDALRVSAYADATIIPSVFRVLGECKQTSVFTYIVKNPSSGLLKIGRSSSPYQRIKSLETGSGRELTICALIKGDIERCLHRRFASLRVFGEWFRDDGSIANFISQEAQS